MALSSDTLATELKNLGEYSDEPPALAAWAQAFATYFTGAQSNLVPILPAALPAAQAAFITAGGGLSTDAVKSLTAGILAFWGALVPAAAWPTVTAITPPPGVVGAPAPLENALKVTFLANTIAALSKDECMDAIAATIHGLMVPLVPPGGIATWPTPGPGPQPIT